MSTVSDKLLSIYNSKNAIKDAIKRKGGIILDNTRFDQYAAAIDGLKILASDPASNTWKPDSTWWDIETVIKNDTTEGYNGSYIVLVSDAELTTVLGGANAYRTSDGAFYTAGCTHAWNTNKDKDSAGGMKTRYIIYYFNDDLCDAASHTLRRKMDNGWEIPFPANALGVVFKCNLLNAGFTSFYDNVAKTTVRGTYIPANMLRVTFMRMLDGYNFYTCCQTFTCYSRVQMVYLRDFPVLLPINFIHDVYPGLSTNNLYATFNTIESSYDDIRYARSCCSINEYKYVLPTTTYNTDQTLPLYPTGFKTIKITGATIVSKTYTSKTYIAIQKGYNANENYILENIYVDGEPLLWTSSDISYFSRLSRQGILNLINAFQDRTGAGTATLTISTTQNNKLTTEDKVALANKNWTLNIVTV